jgi:hypothetical protein
MKTFLLAIATSFLLQSCIFTIIDSNNCISGKGSIITETYTVSEFSSVVHETVFDIEIIQGDEYEIIIEGHENMIDEVDLSISSRGVLTIDLVGKCYNTFDLKVYVTLPYIESVKLESTGDIFLSGFTGLDDLRILNNSTGTIWCTDYLEIEGKLDIRSKSTGDVDIVAAAHKVNVDISSTGDVTIFGECYEQSVRTSSTGHYKAFDLLSEICSVMSNGTGDAEVNVSNKLSISINSTGDVFYTGSADVFISDNSVGDATYVPW